MKTIPLRLIAYARSGDKGSHANIGVLAYTKEGYDFLQHYLTIDCVDQYFKPLGVHRTVRYELPNLWAFNFVLLGVLDGGGSCSLRTDSQGKALGQILLEIPISIPEDIFQKSILTQPLYGSDTL